MENNALRWGVDPPAALGQFGAMLGSTLSFFAPRIDREFVRGDDLAQIILDELSSAGCPLQDGDVLVLCQKIVSKSEGRLIRLAEVTPSNEAWRLADITKKDARLIELVLSESTAVVRAQTDVLIVRHRLGFTVANAGVDQSNLPDGDSSALLLPSDPDASARAVRHEIRARTGASVAVIINDSFGRPWRVGVCGTAIGAAGLVPVVDRRGDLDRHGRTLRVTQIGLADEIAAAASFAMGQADESRPIALMRGLDPRFLTSDDGPGAAALVRPAETDLFR